jgi:hypothetical protein
MQLCVPAFVHKFQQVCANGKAVIAFVAFVLHDGLGVEMTPTGVLLAAACAFTVCSNWDGVYVLYTYAAKRQTARNVQLLLSNPDAGSEDKILRHITLCRM